MKFLFSMIGAFGIACLLFLYIIQYYCVVAIVYWIGQGANPIKIMAMAVALASVTYTVRGMDNDRG